MSRSILFISAMNGDPWGGSEEFWFRTATWMAQNNYEVGCCLYTWPKGNQDKIKALQEAGCKVWLLPNPKQAKNALHKMMVRGKAFRMLKKLCRQPWEIVCINQGGYEDVTHRPFRFLHKHLQKFLLVYHNYNDAHKLSKNRIKNLEKWVSKAKMNTGDAARIFESVQTVSGLTVPRQHVLINPITIHYQQEPPAWPELDEDRYVFSVIAQLDTRRKAQDVLVKALSSPKWRERNWVLYLYGNGNDMQRLKVLIHEKGLNDKVKLMGFTRHVNVALQKTHLLLQITHIDAMPLSVTEAMNMARPCVVSQVGDMPLWIDHGKNGYIAGSVAESGIDKALEEAWQNKENWKQMGIEAHKVFRSKYPQPYEKYYAELMMNL
jgi:glycosyltransferase involved in cell wall biosynthesis